jgi:predicted TIM-barrel enzyme
MGKIGVRLVTRLPTNGTREDEALILCPWLDGPEPTTRFWLGVLSWHDANASLLAAIDRAKEGSHTRNAFAALFCADPFRSPAALFDQLRAKGIGGVVNLPSVTFLDGALSGILQQFELGPERELRFLRQARDAGFRVAGCVTSREMGQELERLGAEFAIVHDGPPVPVARDGASSLLRRFDGLGIPVVTVSSLLQTASEARRGEIHESPDLLRL